MRRRPLVTAAALLALLGIVFVAAVGPIGPWGEARKLSPDVTQPYLGLPGCKSAFTVPAEGPSDKYSPTFEKLVSMADQVYVLCVDCAEVSVPSAWRDKVLLVDGKRIDDCVEDHHMDHWHRATFSHAIAVSHARARGFGNVAIVEDDARSDFTVVFSDADYGTSSGWDGGRTRWKRASGTGARDSAGARRWWARGRARLNPAGATYAAATPTWWEGARTTRTFTGCSSAWWISTCCRALTRWSW
jgi:hypothetical protein